MTIQNNCSEDEYGLIRNATETARLDEQHYWMTRMFTFLVHPSISISSANLRVADIACGSGAWLTDVALQYPGSRCDGFDLSDDAFPSVKELVSKFGDRVRFHVHDAADPEGVADEFKEQFDLVAVRLMHINLVGEQWEQAVKNVVSLLKPGGFVQWIDWDPRAIKVVQTSPGARKAGFEELLSGFQMFLGTRDTGATDRLPEMLERNGIQNIVSELYPNYIDPQCRRFFSKTMTESFPRVLQKMASKGQGGEWDENRIEEVHRVAERDLDDANAFFGFEVWCHVGRKAA